MWPFWDWWLRMAFPPTNKASCDSAHERVARAAKELEATTREVEEANKEVRHGARNISLLMHALADRIARRHAVR